ncbi:MAG: winged helix-turn-helix domain-containing protein [Kaiparowitsia implicata GSE-PSE-MK54-09C]|nr:winged helix-turn-helix domain-containing protein [Kaiparowitsia implicata GSE-PSE-MK54-09C]
MQPIERYRFGPFELDTGKMVLMRGDQQIELRPKAFETLLILLRHAGRLLTKDELVAEVWSNVIVNDDALAQCVRDVRHALKDTDQRYIRTVLRRGYMFVHPTVREQQEEARLARPMTTRSDALHAYLRGRHGWAQRSGSGMRRAIEHFQEALSLDPGLAAAHSGLADCYVSLGKASQMPPAEAFPAARRHAIKAIELDSNIAEPHASLAFVKLYYDWDWAGAETEFQQAVAVDPHYPVSHEWYSVFLLITGRRAEAMREIQLAHRLDPLSVAINSTFAFHHYHAGEHQDAAKHFLVTLEMNPDFAPAYLWLGRTYQALGLLDEALEQFQWVEDRFPHWCVVVAARGYAAGSAGRRQAALQALSELEDRASYTFVAPYSVALVHAGLGDNTSAFHWLAVSFDQRCNWLVWLQIDPRWKNLRSDTRFGELVARMRLPA